MQMCFSDNTLLPYHFFTFPDTICIQPLKRCPNVNILCTQTRRGEGERGKISTKSDYVMCEYSLFLIIETFVIS